MEKRIFNKILKQQMISYGFEKTGVYDYAKEALDGNTKIIVRVPDQTYGFSVGAQFKDFKKDYSDYSGKFNKACMYYGVGQILMFASKYDYSENDIVCAVETVMKTISVFLQKGRDAILERIDEWTFGVENEAKQNDVYTYFGIPLIDPYSDAYILEKVEEWYKCGVKSMMSLDEYYGHKEHYDKYIEYGCQIEIGKEFVTISYKR